MENRVGKHDGNMAFLSVPAAVSSLLTADSMHIIIYLLLCKQSAWQEGVVKWSLGLIIRNPHWLRDSHQPSWFLPEDITMRSYAQSKRWLKQMYGSSSAVASSETFGSHYTSAQSSAASVLNHKVPSNDSCFQCYPPQCCISSTDWCELALHDSAARPLFNLLMQFHFRK